MSLLYVVVDTDVVGAAGEFKRTEYTEDTLRNAPRKVKEWFETLADTHGGYYHAGAYIRVGATIFQIEEGN